jgi:hypothetical protein
MSGALFLRDRTRHAPLRGLLLQRQQCLRLGSLRHELLTDLARPANKPQEPASAAAALAAQEQRRWADPEDDTLTAVKASEITPGLVVHIDTAVIRRLGHAQTNAEVSGTHDRAVRGPHYFLVLFVQGDMCTATPLFSSPAPGSDLLEESKKSGLATKWIGVASYTSRWQHWRMPLASIEPASSAEESSPGDRRTYAAGDEQILARILAWQDRNRCAYRPLN